MVFGEKSLKVFLVAFAAVAMFVSLTSAAVPSYYKGVPYPIGSAPKEIPGRINFHEYDKGGPNISFEQDDMASGHWGNCTAGLRDTGALRDGDSDHPSFSMTNHDQSAAHSPDTFYAAGVSFPNGVLYPSNDTSFAASHFYVGAVHANDYFCFTIHVPKPGKYWISSIWASQVVNISYEIFFIGTQYSSTKDTIRTPVVKFDATGYGSYHAWRRYSDFTSLQLDSGVQELKFHTLSDHLNLDFLHFEADSGKFPTDVSLPSAKTLKIGAFELSITGETVRFTLPDAGKTKIVLFDCLGREIMPVMDRNFAAGNHAVSLNTTGIKQGIYFIRMEHSGATNVAKFRYTR